MIGTSANSPRLIFLLCAAISLPASAKDSIDTYLDLDLTDLLSKQVTSVSKKKQSITETAAAVFVITADDIRRSGVTTIPDALRMAPGIQVAKMDSNKWAISSRGFNSRFVNKLLVMIDGRTVYVPSYSGVYWDAQDTLLEDIDRIEVIRGPGATVWGANAVNGVINIITKSAYETQGGLLTAGTGNEEDFVGFRYGGAISPKTHGRVYAKFNDHDSSYSGLADESAGDQWETTRVGFRLDSSLNATDSWTLQGDAYNSNQNQIVRQTWLDPNDPANNPPNPLAPYRQENTPDSPDSTGWNLLGRWQRQSSETEMTSLQIYIDQTDRQDLYLDQRHNTLDIDFQNRFEPAEGHDLVWGLGYRLIDDAFGDNFNVRLLPDNDQKHLFSAFVQDEIELSPKFRVTLGSKFEHNSYTGLEVQPSVRGLWMPTEGHTFWGAVSRAVRTPSRVEDSGQIVTGVIPGIPPTPTTLIYTQGSSSFKSEEMTSFELGYKAQPIENASIDVALFLNRYKNLGSFENVQVIDLGGGNLIPTLVEFGNGIDATSHGLELAAEWWPEDWWRLQASYTYTHINANRDAGSNDSLTIPVLEGSTPRHQVSLRSSMDLSENVKVDLWGMYVDELESASYSAVQWFNSSPRVPDYTTLNARVAWKPHTDVELSIVGSNLLDKRHPEFIGEVYSIPTEMERSIYGQVRWNFD